MYNSGWYYILSKDSDICHHGVKGQKWNVKKGKKESTKLSEKLDKQLLESHKNLSLMQYSDAVTYYKQILNTNSDILSAWLKKHKLNLKPDQYKKYVLNAVKNLRLYEEEANKYRSRIDLAKNISNRARGSTERSNTVKKLEAIPKNK